MCLLCELKDCKFENGDIPLSNQFYGRLLSNSINKTDYTLFEKNLTLKKAKTGTVFRIYCFDTAVLQNKGLGAVSSIAYQLQKRSFVAVSSIAYQIGKLNISKQTKIYYSDMRVLSSLYQTYPTKYVFFFFLQPEPV